MAKLSISNAWDEAKEVIRRNGNLLVAVGLALLVLPSVVAGLFQPEAAPGELPKPGAWMLLMLVALLIGLVGQLAIIRLSLASGVSVGEAIGHGMRRLFPFLGAVLLVVVPFVVSVSVLVTLVGTDPQEANTVAALLLLLVLAASLYLLVRVMMMAPVASSEPVGPIGIIKRSWVLTRGHWWRLFAFFLLLIIAGSILVIAVGAIMGTIVGIISGGTVERLSLGALLIGLITQIAAAALTIVFMVMLARMYAQLAAGGEAQASVPASR